MLVNVLLLLPPVSGLLNLHKKANSLTVTVIEGILSESAAFEA